MSKRNVQKDKEQCLRCLHCMKVIRCSRFDTGALLHHIEEEHPDLFAVASSRIRNIYKLTSDRSSGESLSHIRNLSSLSQTELNAADSDQCKNKRRVSRDSLAKKTSTAKCNVDQCPSSKDKNTCPKPKTNKPSLPCPHNNMEAFRKMAYKSSVRRWCAVDGSLFCPCCGYKKRPVIKCASDLNSGWCSWSFCFLPCLMSSDNREYLYCCHCNTFLGVYDREKNSVRPNKEYA
ncbi:uncharacterized protein LOC6551273 [Drosophila erecta]|uniref:LITAF domain-containing protein n=1 Tax=Drosophila erecta TaxID=7220 RepID=B3NU43_DROER|nr:uncharacterized protein LOC6551273 [Drosophila erecta]EDV45819.1 uncharacterized protein Dere_GG18533 [Drosophila erecta]